MMPHVMETTTKRNTIENNKSIAIFYHFSILLLDHHLSPGKTNPCRTKPKHFTNESGTQLSHLLAPVPLSLVFLAAILEQKSVFSSSRRSMLLAATTALRSLLNPLDWVHLLVPLVPSSDLAKDLVHYPGPFIIGISSEDEGNVELLNDLPRDVTLVDLDVGRVILASEFMVDDRDGGVNGASSSWKLRAQVLYLAERIGFTLGGAMNPNTWCCDYPTTVASAAGPFRDLPNVAKIKMERDAPKSGSLEEDALDDGRLYCFDTIQQTFSDFLLELLAGEILTLFISCFYFCTCKSCVMMYL